MALAAPRFPARHPAVALRTPAGRVRSGRVRSGWAGRRPPRPATVFTGCGLALLPWMVVLAGTMPRTAEVSNWSAAWIGLDAMLAAGLTGTGLLLRKGDPRVAPVAAATAALLAMDAWFDVTTSAGTGGQGLALLLAAGAELPLAVACAVVAARRTA
ncbi:hypothetical protein [Streptomyces sp. NPDC127112]|uniref:hypothetical protein n=1 Tax=Streptomyces sp. NPDC127112 TaxID=3345364 RepID=UPI00362FE00E